MSEATTQPPQETPSAEPQPEEVPLSPPASEPTAAHADPPPPRQPPTVRAFLTSKFANFARYLEEGGAEPSAVEKLRSLEFDFLCAELIRRAIPHRAQGTYDQAARQFLYELGCSRGQISSLEEKTKAYFECFAEVLGL